MVRYGRRGSLADEKPATSQSWCEWCLQSLSHMNRRDKRGRRGHYLCNKGREVMKFWEKFTPMCGVEHKGCTGSHKTDNFHNITICSPTYGHSRQTSHTSVTRYSGVLDNWPRIFVSMNYWCVTDVRSPVRFCIEIFSNFSRPFGWPRPRWFPSRRG